MKIQSEQLSTRPEGFFTVSEYAADAGIPNRTAASRLSKLVAAGAIKRVVAPVDQGFRVARMQGYIFVEDPRPVLNGQT